MSQLDSIELFRLSGAQAAAATTYTSSVEVDVSGFESVVILAMLGTVTDASVLALKAMAGDVSGALAVQDSPVASVIASTSGQKMLAIEIQRPRYKYLSVRLERSVQNAAVESIVALCSRPRREPAGDGDTIAKALG